MSKSAKGSDHLIGYIKPVSYYTSDAADDLHCVDLGGRRIIKKKKIILHNELEHMYQQSTATTSHITMYL